MKTEAATDPELASNGKEYQPDDYTPALKDAGHPEWEDKLPITGSRTAKWYWSTVHNVTAVVGAGVLGLPYAMKYLTWPGGVVTMILSWLCSLYTLRQLVAMHEMDGKRFSRYHELGQYVFGPKLGLWMVLPSQLIVMVGLGIAYTVTGGGSLNRIYHMYTNTGDTSFGLSCWILVFMACQLCLSQLKNFNDLRVISFAAAIMSLSYSTIAIGVTIHNGRQPNVEYNLNGLSTANGVLNAFNSLGIIAFAYGGHNVVLEIQACMPSPPATFRPYMRGVYIAYIVVSWAYFGVAFTGYWAYGNQVQDNILFTLHHPKGVLAMASAMVFVHVLGSFQVYTVPVFDMLEVQLLKRGIDNSFFCRLIYRSLYVVLVTFVAITFPFFGDILGFIGALGTGPTTFWLPSLMWLIIKKPGYGNWHFWASWFCLVTGIMVTVLGAIGGLRGIIVDASTYSFYQR